MKKMTADERMADPYVKASSLNRLLRCAICAEDTGVDPESLFGDEGNSIWQLLEVAERMSAELAKEDERMQLKLGEGVIAGR